MKRRWDPAYLHQIQGLKRAQTTPLSSPWSLLLLLLLAASSALARFSNDPFYDCAQALRRASRNYQEPMPPEPSARTLQSIEKLRIGTYNSLGIYKNHWSRETKNDYQLTEMFRMINDENPDILFLQEVESIQNLQSAINLALGVRYKILRIPSHDRMQVVAIVKRNLPFDYVIESEIDRSLPEFGHARPFRQHFPVIKVFPRGFAKKTAPLMVLMSFHYKSKRDRDYDPGSSRVASLQFLATRRIVEDLYQQYCRDLAIAMGADFNRDIRVDLEPRSLLGILKDSMNLSPNPIPQDQRITQNYFSHTGEKISGQLDGILVSRALEDKIREVRIPLYQNSDGSPRPMPRNREERDDDPSDHHPVFTDIDFQSLLSHWNNTRNMCVEKN